MSDEIKKVEEPAVEPVVESVAEPVAEEPIVVPVATAATEKAIAFNEVGQKLVEYGADDDTVKKVIEDLGVESIEDLVMLEEGDLTGAGMKLIKARKLLSELKAKSKPAIAPTGAEAGIAIQGQIDSSILPSLPSDESWLSSLKTGGVLKVDDSSYIAAIRAALADKAGLYDVPGLLVKAMEEYAEETEEQVDPNVFFKIRKSLTRRSYADIFEAIDGLDGSFITDARRKEFLGRINKTLWPAIAESYRVLDGWNQRLRSSFTDPSTFMAIFSGHATAGAGIMQVPDTGILHDAGDSIINSINKSFRGTGVQVSAALAYDASVTCQMMNDGRMPPLVGAKNREMMLKKIGASVSPNYVRLEQNLVKYVLAFVKHDSVTSDYETQYFTALWQLGSQIDWASLGIGDAKTKSITGKQIL